MISFSCPDAGGKLKSASIQRGIETEYFYVPNVDEVLINDIDGYALLKMLGLPKLPFYELEVEQLPHLKSMVSDVLGGYDGPMENIGNNPRRYGNQASNAAQYMTRVLKELHRLIDSASYLQHKVQWLHLP